MTDAERIKVLQEGLRRAGQYCRENPPASFPDDHRFFSIIAGGNHRDPEGVEFTNIFLQDALENLGFSLDAE